MQFQDQQLWAEQELELQAADDTSRKFLHFFLEWFTAADEYVSQTEPDVVQPEPHGPTLLMSSKRIEQFTPAQAMRKALTDTETTYGFLAMEWIGQMLLLAFQHWKHGVMMERDLTVIERRSLEIMAAVKAVELQEGATLEPVENDSAGTGGS